MHSTLLLYSYKKLLTVQKGLRKIESGSRYRDEIPVFLIFAMDVQNKKSGISSLYLA